MGDLNNWDRTVIQMAALCHDFDHKGLTNHYIERNESDITKRIRSVSMITDVFRNYTSVVDFSESFNEMMHVQNSVHKIKQLFPNDEYIDIFIKLILSTDLRKHDEYMESYVKKKSKLGFMILIIKIADLSHVLRPFHVHLYWVYKLQTELQLQMCLKETALDTIRFNAMYMEMMLLMFHVKYPIPDLVTRYIHNIEMWERYSTIGNTGS
jgi:hypothetical protein